MAVYRVTKTAEEYRKMAQGNVMASSESFERCDTDGFLSQWGHDQMARVYEALAGLAENGGKSTFVYLADLNGNLVNAKVIPSKFSGSCWMLLDENNKATGEFAPWKPARKNTLAKRGYQEIEVEREAVIMTEGNGGYSINVFSYPVEWLG